MRPAQICWAAAFCVFLAGITQAQSLPDLEDIYINDFADLLSDSDANEIRAMLAEVYDARDIEMVVVTMDRMSTYGHDGEIEPFATRLFNHWASVMHIPTNGQPHAKAKAAAQDHGRPLAADGPAAAGQVGGGK